MTDEQEKPTSVGAGIDSLGEAIFFSVCVVMLATSPTCAHFQTVFIHPTHEEKQ